MDTFATVSRGILLHVPLQGCSSSGWQAGSCPGVVKFRLRSCSPRPTVACSSNNSWQQPHSGATNSLLAGASCCGKRLWRRGSSLQHSSSKRRQLVVSCPAVAETGEVLLPLGLDFLTFLAATVLVIPTFKSVKASPILGFLFSGLILGQLGYKLCFIAQMWLLFPFAL